MDDGEDDDVVAGPDLVEDAVGVGGDLADLGVAEIGDDTAEPRQLGEYAGLLDEFLRNLPGVGRRVAGDSVVDGFEIGFGRIRPSHHVSISRFKSSWLVVWPCLAASRPLRILSST